MPSSATTQKRKRNKRKHFGKIFLQIFFFLKEKFFDGFAWQDGSCDTTPILLGDPPLEPRCSTLRVSQHSSAKVFAFLCEKRSAEHVGVQREIPLAG